MAVAVMIGLALVLLAGGIYAYSSAPPEANATTALIVPAVAAGLMLACAVIGLAGRGKGIGRAAAWAAAALALLFTVGIGMRAVKASAGTEAYPAALAAYNQAVVTGEVADTPEAREAFFEDRGAPDHDTTYLRNTLWTLAVASALAAVGIVVLRPRAADQQADRHPTP